MRSQVFRTPRRSQSQSSYINLCGGLFFKSGTLLMALKCCCKMGLFSFIWGECSILKPQRDSLSLYGDAPRASRPGFLPCSMFDLTEEMASFPWVTELCPICRFVCPPFVTRQIASRATVSTSCTIVRVCVTSTPVNGSSGIPISKQRSTISCVFM